MTAVRLGLAVALGLVLGSMPWWRYGVPGSFAEPHADHAPRYGGQLAMAGDHHVELVREGAWVEVYVSDAWRRPVRPFAAEVVVDGARRVPLRWKGHRFVGECPIEAGEIETIVMLPGDRRLAVAFHPAEESPDRTRASR